MAITLDGTSGITTPTYAGTVTAEYSVPVTAFKNRIINGGMQIDQRNAGASVTVTAVPSQYTLDRWNAILSVTSKYSVQQITVAGATLPFTTAMLITSLSAYSVGASEAFGFRQSIEGLNVADLQWGTASAKTVTLSFWVYSSLTGTFGGSIANSGFTRAYPFSYSIPVANTWTNISVTIAGDTTGTWLTTNGQGLNITWGLGYGSSLSGTSGVWNAGTAFMPTGATSVVSTNGATFYITGVQLEKGTTATSFDYRPYGTELALCQRYCYRTDNAANAGRAQSTSFMYSYPTVVFPVTMRAAPSLLSTPASSFIANSGNNGTPALDGASTQNANLANPSANWTVNAVFKIDATFSAEL